MSQLSFKEFLKLSEKEKCERYEELSEHHKFLARISQNAGARVISEDEMTEDEKEQLRKMRKNVETEEFRKKEKRFNAMLEEAKKKERITKNDSNTNNNCYFLFAFLILNIAFFAMFYCIM